MSWFRKAMSMEAKREALSRLPVNPWRGILYHGTPLSGLIQIVRSGLAPVGGFNEGFLSTSTNDEMLIMFADGESYTGLTFKAEFERVMDLDDFHYALAMIESGAGYWEDLVEKDQEAEDRARDIGYARNGEPHMGYGELAGLLPANVEAVKLPGFSEYPNFATRSESEMAITEAGCDRLRRSIIGVSIRGEDFDAQEGLAKVRTIARLVGNGTSIDEAFERTVKRKMSA